MTFDTRQALSIQAARTINVGRGSVGPVTPASWLLAEGYYMQRNVDPHLIYPRPDIETQPWAKHRRHHPGIRYEVPIGIAFGSGLPYYELVDAPVGATIGSWLVQNGDALEYPDDYGIVKWETPTAGTHSFHVRVIFQDGFTPVDVQWTLTVTTDGTIFIDAVNGSDVTGDGTIGNPFQTIDAFMKNDVDDDEFSGYQVCYRGGLHDISADNTNTGVSAGNWRCEGVKKPLVHYGHPVENAILDFSNTTIVFQSASSGLNTQDVYFGGLTTQGLRDTNNPRQFSIFVSSGDGSYQPTNAGSRFTFYDVLHKNCINDTNSDDNSAIIWSPNTTGGAKRHYFYAKKVRFENCATGPNYQSFSPVNFNGYYLAMTEYLLTEDVSGVDTGFGRGYVFPKSSATYWCHRRMITDDQQLQIMTSGSYNQDVGGPHEISYSRLSSEGSNTASVAFQVNTDSNAYDPNNSEMGPVYLSKTILDRSPVGNRHAVRWGDDWEVNIDSLVIVSGSVRYLGDDPITGFVRFDVDGAPVDENGNLTGAARETNLGLFGPEVKAEFRG